MANTQHRHRCECNRSFATINALAQHQRDSPRHQNGLQTNNTEHAAPTLIAGATRGKAAAASAPAITPDSTPAPGQKTPGSERKRNKKKNNKGGKKTQTSASSGSTTFTPRRYYDGYTLGEGLGYPRYSSTMYLTWEDVYRIEGPDHTQCSSDCDWCGMCAIRNPF